MSLLGRTWVVILLTPLSLRGILSSRSTEVVGRVISLAGSHVASEMSWFFHLRRTLGMMLLLMVAFRWSRMASGSMTSKSSMNIFGSVRTDGDDSP